MTVRELKEALANLPEECNDLPVEIDIEDMSTGCDTCGYGAAINSETIMKVAYLEGSGRVELVSLDF